MINSPDNRDILNIAEALERIDGDEELLHELWTIFIDEMPKQITALKTAVESTDFVLVERLFCYHFLLYPLPHLCNG